MINLSNAAFFSITKQVETVQAIKIRDSHRLTLAVACTKQ